MGLKSQSIILLSEMINNQEGVFFALLSGKTEGKTKEGKPFYRVTFGDSKREVQSAIWADSPLFQECRDQWRIGQFYKISAVYKLTDYGPQIVVHRIREAGEKDFADGFSKNLCRPSSETDPALLYDEILSLAKSRIAKTSPLLALIGRIFKEFRERILELPSTREHHHAYSGGFLEHTLSTAKIASFMADHYASFYSAAGERLSRELVTAGAILHEIGKVDEMEGGALSPRHSLAGALIGYPVLGRDIIRRFAPDVGLDSQTQLRLEHIILTHPRFSDWGTVGKPVSLEAIIVHEADYSDSVFAGSNRIIITDAGDGPLTASKGPLGGPLLK